MKKKIVSLLLVLCLVFALAACGGSDDSDTSDDSSTDTTDNSTSDTSTDDSGSEDAAEPEDNGGSDDSGSDSASAGGETEIDYDSDVTALEGNWTISKVYTADDGLLDAEAGAITVELTGEEDPSELVDDAAYIHNRVWNFTAKLAFGISDIADELAGDDIEYYKGSAGWADFVMGEVVDDGDWYKQNGPASIAFKDIDDYGLYLDQVAGASDIDTTEKKLTLGMNSAGQLLIGYSEDRISTDGAQLDWDYLLIFDKA